MAGSAGTIRVAVGALMLTGLPWPLHPLPWTNTRRSVASRFQLTWSTSAMACARPACRSDEQTHDLRPCLARSVPDRKPRSTKASLRRSRNFCRTAGGRRHPLASKAA
jgi:hypothetical protein